MDSSQYTDYLNDRRRKLEIELQSLVEQLIKLSNTADASEQRYHLCLAIEHASEALTRIIKEDHHVRCDDLTCKRCGTAIQDSRLDSSPLTRYCAHCAN